MKKPLLAAAISMALAASAQADSQFYGKMNVSTSYNDTEDAEAFKLNDHASRLGIKGSSELGSNTVIYQAEFSVPTDTGGIGSRDTYIGLQYAGMGTIKMGKMDTPLKKSQGKFDLFNDVVDIKNLLDGENRENNSINYTTEKMGELQVSASVIFAENGSSDGYSASAVFKADSIYAAAAYDTKVDGGESTVRLTGIYNLGDLSFGALINQVDSADVPAGADELAFAVNASMKMGSNTLKAQVEMGDQGKLGEAGGQGGQSISFGVDHKLAKTTKAYAYLNQFEADSVDSNMTIGLGLEHKF